MTLAFFCNKENAILSRLLMIGKVGLLKQRKSYIIIYTQYLHGDDKKQIYLLILNNLIFHLHIITIRSNICNQHYVKNVNSLVK